MTVADIAISQIVAIQNSDRIDFITISANSPASGIFRDLNLQRRAEVVRIGPRYAHFLKV